MASPIEAQLLLCDSAVADPSGKVHMLGAGWSMTSSPTAPHAVAVLAKIPWDRANQKLPLTLQLRDSDGQDVEVPTSAGDKKIGSEGNIEVGRPPGVSHGSPLDASFALNLPSLPLSPGRYEWRLTIAEFILTASFEVITQVGSR